MTSVMAAEYGKLIFSDDFQRTESQETRDEPGNGWNTNSKSRAKGNKQVDLRDGAMYIYISEAADHAVSVTQPAEFTDGAITLQFMLEDDQDSLGLDFADLQCKQVHAGHLFVVRVSPKQVHIQDLKTGSMDLTIREARQANTLTDEQKKLLRSKEAKISHSLATQKWHDLVVQVQGDRVYVDIDGTRVGEFQSEGIKHPTKRMLRLGVARNAVVDDVKIYRHN
jgi:hypothetical protein